MDQDLCQALYVHENNVLTVIGVGLIVLGHSHKRSPKAPWVLGLFELSAVGLELVHCCDPASSHLGGHI